MKFYITNSPKLLVDKKGAFITNLRTKEDIEFGGIFFHIDGYIIPRTNIFEEYKNQSQPDLLINLFKKYGEQFVRYIKGVFNIVIIDKSRFLIYNDRHAIKKVFTYTHDGYFFISNDLISIKEHFPFAINPENAAVFTLVDHFINGDTLFEKICCSGSASKIEFSDNQLKTSFYWKPNELFLRGNEAVNSKSDFTVFWEKLVTSYVKYLKPKQISITLTGGNDSRLVLAPLLRNGYSMHAFSFGNHQSFDVVISKKIAAALQLTYSNYFVINPSKEWLFDQSEKLIEIGNTLINFHRAHRNDALETELLHYPDTDMIFSGLMGGEYLKEPYYDDVVLPKFFYLILKIKNKEDIINYIEEQLKQRSINTEFIDLNKIYEKIMSFLDNIICADPIKSKFLLTHYYYGCSHHTQDSYIFNYYCKYGVNPFMDIDFLEKLSSSNLWYINSRNNPFRRIFHSRLYIKITDDLAPELSHISYAKKGQYTAYDMLNRPLLYLWKRFKYFIMKDKNKYPANFAMGDWLYLFSSEQLDNLHPAIEKLFNKDQLITKLESVRFETAEAKWHPVTNPINLSLYLKAYESI